MLLRVICSGSIPRHLWKNSRQMRHRLPTRSVPVREEERHPLQLLARAFSASSVSSVSTNSFFSTKGHCNLRCQWHCLAAFPIQSTNIYGQHRSFSSRSGSGGRRPNNGRSDNRNTEQHRFHLDALPFSVSPEEALSKFQNWAEVEQGLRWLLSYSSIQIGAAYVPMWSFDVTIRFPNGSQPPLFDIYGEPSPGSTTTVHLPGLSAYAGYSYRRSLINPVHSTSLVFLGEETQPFGGWMLRDMQLKETGANLSVVPDAWNATKGRALASLREDLQTLVDQSWESPNGDPAPSVQLSVQQARRVFLPTFVIDYQIAGLDYRAFVSGCDQAAPVAGVSHQVFGTTLSNWVSSDLQQESRNFMTWSSSTILRNPQATLPLLIRILRPAAAFLWVGIIRFWASLPIVGAATGVLAGYRKILQPWIDARTASADWERQREAEGLEADTHSRTDDFDDQGRARRFFHRNRDQILRSLSGSQAHEEGTYDWYKEWQEWAETQWRQQQQQQQQQWNNQYGQQQQQQQRGQQQSSGSRNQQQQRHWDFNPSDPYSVLGVSRGASKKEVSEAFRKKMLMYHPDTQPNATKAQRERLEEQSKLVTEAYRTIRAQQKKK